MTTLYKIRIKGHLGKEWASYFDGFSLDPLGNGETLLTGEIMDQPALHGLLAHIRDLGLPLLAVNRVEDDEELYPPQS